MNEDDPFAVYFDGIGDDPHYQAAMARLEFERKLWETFHVMTWRLGNNLRMPYWKRKKRRRKYLCRLSW